MRPSSNLASVAMEINPANGAQTYSTLNYVAPEIPGGAWTKITADQERWYLTGAAGTATGCNQVTYCTLGEVKAALPSATLYTGGISPRAATTPSPAPSTRSRSTRRPTTSSPSA